MTGLEGPAISIAARIASASVKRYFSSTEYERLCERLAVRFEKTGLSAAFFLDMGKDKAFAAALAPYISPPHRFERGALIEAITPLVGPLDKDSDAENFAAEIADAIREGMREAKSGDELVRFEMDRVLEATGAPVAALDSSWAPQRARPHLQELIDADPRAASALQQALAGKELGPELDGLIAHPQAWLREGGPALWKTMAHLAEVVGGWSAARTAWETYEEMPGADRIRGIFGAADAAHHNGEAGEAKALRERASELDPEHELVQLLKALELEDPAERLADLEILPPGATQERDARRKAFISLALGELGREPEALEMVREALAQAPYDLRAKQAQAASILAANQRRWEEGRAPDRAALREAIAQYRDLVEALRESRRPAEAGAMFACLVNCEILTGRIAAARSLLAETPEEGLVGEVPVELAGLALAAGDPERAEDLIAHYDGDSAAGRSLQVRTQLRNPSTRTEAIATLDRGVEKGEFEMAVMRLMAAVPGGAEVAWSEVAEELVRDVKPTLASQLKADWYERRGESEAARRELARHANDARAVRALMLLYAQDQRWDKAVPHALALLEFGPDLDDRVAAGQVLRRAGETNRAETELRTVFEHAEADAEERSAAFDELADILMRAGRIEDAQRIAAEAERAGIPSARWLTAHAMAWAGRTEEAFKIATELRPRNELDRTLLSDLIYAHESSRRGLERLIEIAEELPEPDEHLEAKIVLALLRCKEEELNPELIARAGPERFVEDFPNSKVLWRESIPEEESELLEKLRELTEPRAKAVALAEEQIFERGEWPVGALASAGGRSLGETWAAMRSLPISYSDEGMYAGETEAINMARGGPVVIETGALCVLELLPDEVVATILVELPYSERTTALISDLLTATMVDVGRSDETVKSIAWDATEGRPVVHEVSATETQLPRRRAERMLELAQKLKAAPRGTEAGTKEEGNSGIAAAYKQLIAHARSTGRIVYSDDRALRRALVHEGIRSFGTVSLLEALVKSGAVSPDAANQARAALRHRGAIELVDEAR